MRGILTTICAFALIGSVVSTFPNDLYYHHHPDLAVADARSGGNIRHAQQQSNGHSRNNRNNHRNPPHRNAYHGGRHHRNNHGHRNSYGHYKRDVNGNQQGNIVYTAEGGIDWSKSKVSKVAADTTGHEQQEQRDRGYDTSPNNYQRNQRNPFEDDEYDDEQQSSSRYDDNRYNSYGNDNSRYYDDDEYDNYNYDNDYDVDYKGHSRNSNYNRGNDYSDDRNFYDYDDQDNGYRGYNNKQKYSSGRNAYTTTSGGDSLPFANGIRLAGTLPDDGYNRGEGTFYDLETHIGTCGKQSKNSEYVVALNAEQMGDSSSRNENCNKEVEITGPSGKSVRATIVDNCKTCKKGGLDLSPAAFEEIGEFSQGSIPIKWKFI